MINSEVKAMFFSFLRVFLASALSAFVGLGQNIFDLGVNGWKGILGAAVASTAVVVINWLNSNDPRYGLGSEPLIDPHVLDDLEDHLDVPENPVTGGV